MRCKLLTGKERVMNNSTNNWQHTAPIIAMALGLIVSATVALAQNTTTQRPIEDFVRAQGTICFDPPDCFLNYQGWDTLLPDLLKIINAPGEDGQEFESVVKTPGL